MAFPDGLESLSTEELQAMHDNMASQLAMQSQPQVDIAPQGYDINYGQRVAGGLGNFASKMTLGLSDKAIVGLSDLFGTEDAAAKWDAVKGSFAENAPITNTGVGIAGSLAMPASKIGAAMGLSKLGGGVLDLASKVPTGRFFAQRAVDFVPGAMMSGIEGYNSAPEGEELGTGISSALTGGAASMLLSPVARTLSGSRAVSEKMARSQEAKAFGLTSNDVAKSALTSPSAAIEEGETLIQKQLSQIIDDVDAKTAKSGEELFARVIEKKNQLGAKYDQIVNAANEINGGKAIKFNATDKKSILDWIDSPAVPTGEKKALKTVAVQAIEDFNTSKGASLNPFEQLKTDRTSYNAAFKDVNPDAATRLSKQMRKLFSAKLKASLSQVSGNKEVGAALAKDLTELDKAYAPYAALRNSIAKVKGKDATSLSLEDGLRSIATTSGLGTFIKTGFDKGGIIGGLATTAVAAPALMFARTPGGALSTARAAEGIGKFAGGVGDVMGQSANPLIANYLGSVGESNQRFRAEQEARLAEQMAPVPMQEQQYQQPAQPISLPELISSQPPIIQAMIGVESNKNPRAVSKAGAMGLMQLMPANAKKLGIDPFDPEQNIQGGMAILSEEMDRYKDPILALAAYNAGSPKVNAAIKKAGSRDWNKVKRYLKAETRAYPAKVMAMLGKIDNSGVY